MKKKPTKMTVIWDECKAIKTMDLRSRKSWLGSLAEESGGWAIYVHKKVIVKLAGLEKDLETAKRKLIEAATPRRKEAGK